MNRIILSLILSICMLGIGYSQETAETKEQEPPKKEEAQVLSTDGNVYQEITLEDFENVEFKESDIIFQKARYEEYKVAIRDEAPAPIANSKKYNFVPTVSTILL